MKFSVLNSNTVRYQPEGFRLFRNECGPFLRRWLINKMWQWLHNCGALEPYFHEYEEYYFERAQEEAILEAIRGQIYQLFESGVNPIRDFCVIVGAEKWAELTRAHVDTHMTFYLETPIHYTLEGGYRGSVHGLPIHVVQRMDGIALVPKVAVEKVKD